MRYRQTVLAFTLVLIALPGVANGQQGRPGAWEVGYQLAHVPDDTLPLGFALGFVGRVTPTWSIVGEVAGARESNEGLGVATTFSIFDFGGGARWAPAVAGPWMPFVQFLAGGLTRRVSFEPDVVNVDQTETDFMMQPAVGIAWQFTDRTAAVTAVKFTETLTEDEFDIGDEYRIFFGVRLDF
jgi:hypothetical protein